MLMIMMIIKVDCFEIIVGHIENDGIVLCLVIKINISRTYQNKLFDWHF